MKNPAFKEKNSQYYTRFKHWMLPLIQAGPNAVLDLGCASGRMGAALLEQGKAAEVTGVEIFEDAAAEASRTYQRVFVGDIEELHLDFVNQFDYAICGDILEHLKDPYAVTRQIRRWLKPGGSLLVCVPNVRNYHVLADLIFRGKWEYQPAGIMDKTHVRFFTRSSCRQMLAEAGFEVYHEEMIVTGNKKRWFNRMTFRLFEEFLAEQSFCCGRKPTPATFGAPDQQGATEIIADGTVLIRCEQHPLQSN